MYCDKCGSELPDDARFCQICGAPAPTAEAPETPASASGSEAAPELAVTSETPVPEAIAPSVTSAEEPRFSQKQIACMVVAGVAVVAAIVCIVLFCLNPPDTTVPDSASNASNTSNVSTANTSSSSTATEAATNTTTNTTTNIAADTTSTESTPQGAINQSETTGQILPDSNSRYYTREELEALSDYELYLARNEIYARLGRGFKNQDLVNWFNGKDWYVERYSPTDFDALPDQRNDYEHANSDLMMEIETERGSQYL